MSQGVWTLLPTEQRSSAVGFYSLRAARCDPQSNDVAIAPWYDPPLPPKVLKCAQVLIGVPTLPVVVKPVNPTFPCEPEFSLLCVGLVVRCVPSGKDLGCFV